MPETKFTPGPWASHRTHWASQDVWYVIVDRNGRGPIMEAGGKDHDGQIAEAKHLITDPAEIKANAHLIAAAPDLYASLLELKQMLGNEGEYSVCRSDRKPMDFPEVITVGSVFERASDALAKARGES